MNLIFRRRCQFLLFLLLYQLAAVVPFGFAQPLLNRGGNGKTAQEKETLNVSPTEYNIGACHRVNQAMHSEQGKVLGIAPRSFFFLPLPG